MTDKPHAAALEAAEQIVIRLGRSRERIGAVAGQITEAYKPLVKAAGEMLNELGFSGPGEHDTERYYCQFCRAIHEEWNKIEHSETCPVVRWRAVLRKLVGHD